MTDPDTIVKPSKSERIVALRALGRTEREIARELRIKPNTVTSMEARFRQRNCRREHQVLLDGNVYLDLVRAAGKRGMSATELANRMLSVIAKDQLVGAILDE